MQVCEGPWKLLDVYKTLTIKHNVVTTATGTYIKREGGQPQTPLWGQNEDRDGYLDHQCDCNIDLRGGGWRGWAYIHVTLGHGGAGLAA